MFQSGNWVNDPCICKKVIELSNDMIEYSIKARQESKDEEKGKLLQADQQLTSARLTGQAVIRVIEKQWPDLHIEKLKEQFRIITEYIKSVMYAVFNLLPFIVLYSRRLGSKLKFNGIYKKILMPNEKGIYFKFDMSDIVAPKLMLRFRCGLKADVTKMNLSNNL